MRERERPFEERLVAERSKLLALARVLVHAADADAEDVVQTAMLKAIDREEPLREPGSWLRRVLRNEARERVRTRERREARAARMVQAEPTRSQEDELARAEVAAAVCEALAALEPPYRETLHRRFVDDMSPGEIAIADGDSPATVRWRVHEGLRRMRERLDQRFDGREAWCGGFAIVLGLPGPSTGGVVMSTPSFAKIILLLVGATAAVVVMAAKLGAATRSGQGSSGDAEAIVSAPKPAASDPAGIAAALAPADDGAGAPSSEPPDSGADDDPRRLLSRALVDCVEGAPEGSLVGLERLELSLLAYGTDDGVVWHDITVTTGRAVPGEDEGCSELGPIDAPGVARHDAIAQCLRDTLDPAWLPLPPPMPGEGTGVSGVIVPLDGAGHVKPTPHEEPAPPLLPDVSDEPVLDPHRAAEAFALPRLGPPRAAIELVECGSYVCPFCEKSEATLAVIRERYRDLSVAWLNMPGPPGAVLAAKAGVAARHQGKFWEMHAGLFALDPPLEREAIVAVADQVGLDRARFEADLDADETAREVARHKQTCKSAGAWATPTFFVNGDMIRGELGVDALAKSIDEIVALDR